MFIRSTSVVWISYSADSVIEGVLFSIKNLYKYAYAHTVRALFLHSSIMKLDGNYYTVLHSVASPFLSTGLTAAVFQIDRKTLSFKQRLRKRVRWTEITSFAAINDLLCIKSGPVAFWGIKIGYYLFNLRFSQLDIIYFTVKKCNLW